MELRWLREGYLQPFAPRLAAHHDASKQTNASILPQGKAHNQAIENFVFVILKTTSTQYHQGCENSCSWAGESTQSQKQSKRSKVLVLVFNIRGGNFKNL